MSLLSERHWGYGDAPHSEGELQSRFAGLCQAMLADLRIAGYCYTQLTDICREANGVYRADRSAKLDVTRLRAVQPQPAAIEAGGAG